MNVKAFLAKHQMKVSIAIATMTAMVSTAMADLTSDLANYTQIATSLTSMFTSVIAIFNVSPLNIFVGLGILITFISLVAGLLMRRGRRR